MTGAARHRVILKLMTAGMLTEELGLPVSTARTLMERLAWKYGAVRIKGLQRNFIRRRDLERELEPVGALEPNPDGQGMVPAKLITIPMIAKENGLTMKAYKILEDISWRLQEYGGRAFQLADCRAIFLRRGDIELRLREIAPYDPARPPGVMARTEIAEELGLSLADTEALLRYIRSKEDPLVPVGRKDFFLREAIARYVETGDVPERVLHAIGASS